MCIHLLSSEFPITTEGRKKWFAFNRIQLFCVWRCDDANGIIYSVAHSVGIARAGESEKEMGRRAVH